MIRFKKRSSDQEQMDDLTLGRNKIKAILRDINMANSLLGGNRITLKALKRLMTQHPAGKYNVLDVGCGDGTLLREVAMMCKREGIEVCLTGIDLNADSISLARQKNSDLANITFERKDVFDLNPERDGSDFIICTLTLHHFSDEEILKLIGKFSDLVRFGVVINDLDRSRIAFTLFRVFSAIFMKTPIARQDGLTSIKRGFTRSELLSFSKSLKDADHKIRWRWAFRYEWSFWHKNGIVQ